MATLHDVIKRVLERIDLTQEERQTLVADVEEDAKRVGSEVEADEKENEDDGK